MAVRGKISSAAQQRSGKLKFVAPFWEVEAGNDPEVGKEPLPHPTPARRTQRGLESVPYGQLL